MRYEVKLDHLPGGIAIHGGEAGETIQVAATGFITDSNGSIFYKLLEHFQTTYLKPFLKQENEVSGISHCLVIVNPNHDVIVYVNELLIKADLVARGNVRVGDLMGKLDIAGIMKVYFDNISIPTDCGVQFYFTIGWKRGFFFDFRPLHNPAIRLNDLDRRLATHFEYLLFDEIYSIDEEVWKQLFGLGWFPFISIRDEAFERLVSRLGEARPTEITENTIIDKFDVGRLHNMVADFKEKGLLEKHIPFLEAGIERYIAGDYLSSINNIWPRIEGVLRLAFAKNINKREGQKDLVGNMEEIVFTQLKAPSVYLPDRFREYLLTYYYRDFDLTQNNVDVSRHSIAHGVSDANDYDRKTALLGILMIDQLTYYLQLKPEQNPA